MNNLYVKHNDLYDPFLKDLFGLDCTTTRHVMRTDIIENENEYLMNVEVPSVNKENINLDLKDGYLTIKVSQVEENNDEDKKVNYILHERRSRTYERSYFVGEEIKEENIKAKLDNNLLRITISKPTKEELEEKKILVE